MSMYTFRPRKDEDSRIEEFLKKQSGGYGDILRYFIEKEIAENGIRDLTLLIPAKRNIDDMIVLKSNNMEKVIKENKVNSKVFKDKEIHEEKNNEITSELVIEDVERDTKEEIDKNKLIAKEATATVEATEDIITKDEEEINIDEDIQIPEKEFVEKKNQSINKLKEDTEDLEDDEIPSCFM